MHEQEPKGATLFDLDGTLHDNEEFINGSFNYAIKGLGYEPKTREEIGSTFGLNLIDSYKKLFPKGDIEELCRLHRVYQKENLNLLSPYPNTLNTLGGLRKSGLKVAVVTNRSRESAVDGMTATGVMQKIDFLVTGNDVSLPKPDPEGINIALEHFKIKPVNAFMVGDCDVDVMAGKAAGVKTIGITSNHLSAKELINSNPDYLVNDIAEIMPVILLQLEMIKKLS